MTDPLSLLRQYHIQKKEIVTKGDNICFGELSFPKSVMTNYMVYGSGKNGDPYWYYTLECLLFLLQNINMVHASYVRRAKANNLPIVRRPDRKELLAYLCGVTSTSEAIDKTGPLERPTQVKRPVDDAPESTAKKLHQDNSAGETIKEECSLHCDVPKKSPIVGNTNSSLAEAMSTEKIAALKAKRVALKQTTVKEEDQ